LRYLLAEWAEVRGINGWKETLRTATQVGAPLGAESFVADLEQRKGRPLKLRTHLGPLHLQPRVGYPDHARTAKNEILVKIGDAP
jgi:hypothetical protein